MYTFESFKTNVIAESRVFPEKLFLVRCTNDCDEKRYYLKNGKLADAKVFNTKWAFENAKRTKRHLHSDGIYKITEIDQTNDNNKRVYNL